MVRYFLLGVSAFLLAGGYLYVRKLEAGIDKLASAKLDGLEGILAGLEKEVKEYGEASALREEVQLDVRPE